MNQVSVQKIREENPSLPLLQETIDLLDRVRTRAFELFERRGGTPGSEVADWLSAEKEIFRVPDMELAENDKEFQLQLALPGFEPQDIHVAATPDAVIVEGEVTHRHQSTQGTVHVCEFGERRLFREIPLPEKVDVEHVTATLDKGVLQVRAAKREQGRNKRAVA